LLFMLLLLLLNPIDVLRCVIGGLAVLFIPWIASVVLSTC
jgi:hypothetical protein